MTPRLPGSIRVRITAVAAVVVAVVLAVTAVVILSVQRDQLVENLDRSLEQRTEAILAGLASGEPSALAVSNDGDRFVQQIDADGVVVAASPNVTGLPPAVDPGTEGASTVSDFDLEDDFFRVVATPDSNGGTLVVGENIDDVNDAIRNLRVTLAVALPAVVAVLAALVWWLVGRTLEPVARVRHEVAEIRAGALGRRVARPHTDDEISRLVDTMNDMLDRLEAAAKSQQSFIADASHELKSPLTRMRTEIEVELASSEVDDPLIASLLEDVTALQTLVEDLLHLAGTDAGVRTRRRAIVDLDYLVLQEARILADATTLHIDTSAVAAVQVDGEEVELVRMVRNLTDNAARHADQIVSITVQQVEEGVQIVVTDDGPGVDERDRERIFERFTRLDEARTAATGGTGLGLAIVRDIVDRHGGHVRAEAADPSGLRVVVELPSVADESLAAG